MKELNEGFEHYLKNRRNEAPHFFIHPGQQNMKSETKDSATGEPFSHFYTIGELVRAQPLFYESFHVRV
jgi:hypothetical protein